MTSIFRLVSVLTFTAALSGGLLSYFNLLTAPKISAYKNTELEKSISLVIPNAVLFDETKKGDLTFFIGRNEQKEIKGIAFKATGNGYQDKITVLVGTNPDITNITSIVVIEQKETPGLGTKIEDDKTNPDNPKWFIEQFKNLDATKSISYVKNKKPSNQNEVQAISGATISSSTVVNILNEALPKARELYLSK